jgi:hypothetical protein
MQPSLTKEQLPRLQQLHFCWLTFVWLWLGGLSRVILTLLLLANLLLLATFLHSANLLLLANLPLSATGPGSLSFNSPIFAR